MAQISIDFDPQSSNTKINLSTDDGLTGKMEFEPAQLLELIQALGGAYAKATSAAPTPDLDGQKVNAVGNAKWMVHSNLTERSVCISFYHLKFGPVGFLLAADQARRFQNALSVAIDGSESLRPKVH
jgi:hypothetical protein